MEVLSDAVAVVQVHEISGLPTGTLVKDDIYRDISVSPPKHYLAINTTDYHELYLGGISKIGTTDVLADAITLAKVEAAIRNKLNFITVTQAVDLDAIETLVANLDQAVVLKGVWDASSGAFPGAGAAQAGWAYRVSVAGTTGGTAFSVGDTLIAIVDNASTSTYAANWFKEDHTSTGGTGGTFPPEDYTGTIFVEDGHFEGEGTYSDPLQLQTGFLNGLATSIYNAQAHTNVAPDNVLPEFPANGEMITLLNGEFYHARAFDTWDQVIKAATIRKDLATASGTDTYAVTLAPVPTAYALGQRLLVLFTNANTGAATINVNSLGAKAITKNGTTALAAGDIPAGAIKLIQYDGTRFQIIGDGSGGGSSGITTGTGTPTTGAPGTFYFDTDDGILYAFFVADTPIIVPSPSGTGAGIIPINEGTPSGAAAGKAVISADAPTHRAQLSNNNSAFSDIMVRSDIASQAQAEAGTNTTTLMTPERVKQAAAVLAMKPPLIAASAPAQAIPANTDTYITGSNIDIAGRLKVGTLLRWKVQVSKTAAGTAAPVFQIRFGTAGAIGDTSRISITMAAQTAAVDVGVFEVSLFVTTAGASGIAQAYVLLNHGLAATGLQVGSGGHRAASGAFDMTVASLKAGLSVNTGASSAWTVNLSAYECFNLA
jgi:hypothetical protein